MSTNVFVGFDPYVGWLSVHSEQRPLGPYQLLNLEPLEPNPAKINAAIIRQRRALESFRAGANPQAWEAVRNELEAAITTLSNGDSKAILDASIQRKSAIRNKRPSGQRAAAGPTIACRQCAKSNTSERKFCGDCGEGLWDTCGACDAEVPVDEKFCGICGANLHAAVASELQQARDTLAQAQRHCSELRYDEALYNLRKLAKSTDPRLDDVIEDGLLLIRNIEDRIAQHKAAAQDALERALMLISGFAYEGAIAELSDVPAKFQTEEIVAALTEATSKRNEILTLSGEIREDIENKRTTDLLPKLERLLKLKPNHSQAQKLAEDMRDRLLISGKKKLLEHRYGEALDLLRSVPTFVRTAEIDKLTDQAEELHWLITDVRQSPLADQTLNEVLDRLLKVAPGNSDAVKLREQLTQRRLQKPSDARQRYLTWASAPKRTRLGWPVDWLTDSQRLRTSDPAIVEQLEANPGRFFVAIGLALHGLGRGTVDINLIPEEKSTVFTQFKSLLRKKAVRTAWGLDLNTYGLRAVKLVMDDKEVVTIADACFLKYRKVLSQPDAELERGVIASETLKAFTDKHPIGDARVAVNMPGQKLLGRFFDMPPLDLKKVHDAVLFEARHQIPYQLESLAWDYDLITAGGQHAEGAETRRTVIVAGRDYHVQERLGLFKELGMKVDVLQSDCVALHNFISHEFFSPDHAKSEVPQSHDAIVTVDVGAECTNLVVTSPSVHWFRTLSIGGDNFTEPLVKQFKLTHSQADLLKREPHRARRMSQLYESFDPILDELAADISKSLDAFLKLFPDQTLARIYGVGGGFQLHGLLRRLRSGK